MRYSEPPPPENINVTRVHPLRELAVLLGGALVLVAVIGLLLGFAGGKIARLIPYAQETRLAPALAVLESHAPPELSAYVDGLREKLQTQFVFPEGMQVRIDVNDAPTVNAIATLGGRIVLFRGLLEKLPNENALAMLLAHEMAHLAFRHPIEALGEQAAVQVGMALLGATDLGVLNSAGNLVARSYSRRMEREADDAARAAVRRVYGHLVGADALFEVLLAETEASRTPWDSAFFSTHPATKERLSRVRGDTVDDTAGARVTPLPEAFAGWLDAVAKGPFSRER